MDLPSTTEYYFLRKQDRMDLNRMLEMCRRDQWATNDLNWTGTPRELSPSDEQLIVQLFTDMAGIERLAAALFEEQFRRADDERLREIFRSFVDDEIRHAEVAEKLADYYNVHQYKEYKRSQSLEKFFPHFVKAIRLLSNEIATIYITAGELVLDVALLRSINDYVHDEMSESAMRLINRDESRHIAIDYHMVEYYSLHPEAARKKDPGNDTLMGKARAAYTFVGLLYHARPFFKDVFFQPLKYVDPTGRRIKEAFKRLQLLRELPNVALLPFSQLMLGVMDLYNTPIVGDLFGSILVRIAGIEPELLKKLYSDAEAERARRSTFDEMAQEALSVKNQGEPVPA